MNICINLKKIALVVLFSILSLSCGDSHKPIITEPDYMSAPHNVYVIDIDTKIVTKIADNYFGVIIPAFDLVVSSIENSIRLLDINTGRVKNIPVPGLVFFGCFSEDGTKFTYRKGTGEIYISNSDGSNQSYVTDGGYHRLSPDAKYISYIRTKGETHSLALFNFETKEERIIKEVKNPAYINQVEFSNDGMYLLCSEVGNTYTDHSYKVHKIAFQGVFSDTIIYNPETCYFEFKLIPNTSSIVLSRTISLNSVTSYIVTFDYVSMEEKILTPGKIPVSSPNGNSVIYYKNILDQLTVLDLQTLIERDYSFPNKHITNYSISADSKKIIMAAYDK